MTEHVEAVERPPVAPSTARDGASGRRLAATIPMLVVLGCGWGLVTSAPPAPEFFRTATGGRPADSSAGVEMVLLVLGSAGLVVLAWTLLRSRGEVARASIAVVGVALVALGSGVGVASTYTERCDPSPSIADGFGTSGGGVLLEATNDRSQNAIVVGLGGVVVAAGVALLVLRRPGPGIDVGLLCGALAVALVAFAVAPPDSSATLAWQAVGGVSCSGGDPGMVAS